MKTRWGGIIKSESALQFCSDFHKQVAKCNPFLGKVAMTVTVWYKDNRRDLDISLLQDCIQKSGIIKNDRQIIEIHAFRKMDKHNPRVIFSLMEI